MRKVIAALILVLIGTYIALTLISDNKEYAAERMFYKALKMSQKVVMNPEIALPGLISSVDGTYRKLMEKFPNTQIAKRAHMALAEFYMAVKKYDDAIKVLTSFVDAKYDNADLSSRALLFKAAIFEKQGQWDKALKEYKIMQELYSQTPLGMMVPIYLGRYYAKKGDSEASAAAYRDAALYYEKLENDNRGNIIGFTASNLALQAYMEIGNFEAAGTAVESAMKNYPLQYAYEKYLPFVEHIYVVKLNRPDKALEIYNDVIGKIKDGNFKKFVEKKIEELRAKIKKQAEGVK